MVFACAVFVWCVPANSQAKAGCAGGYRVIARRWDVVLSMGWELRQDCTHTEWPARSVAIGSTTPRPEVLSGIVMPNESVPMVQPLLVHAGDQVRLWMREGSVHIEMSGVVERSARNGERVFVQITRRTDDAGMTVQRISGIVRGMSDVEMER